MYLLHHEFHEAAQHFCLPQKLLGGGGEEACTPCTAESTSLIESEHGHTNCGTLKHAVSGIIKITCKQICAQNVQGMCAVVI